MLKKTMSLRTQSSGREHQEGEGSLRLDPRDPYSSEVLAQRSTEQVIQLTQSELSDTEFDRVGFTGWYLLYRDCVQHFFGHSQHTPTVQSIAAFINIRLPYQHTPEPSVSACASNPTPYFSLHPYIRRLIITAQDTPAIMGAFFGDHWEAAVGCIYKRERINYLFTAKSSGWASTKMAYDMLPNEQAPFLRPLRDPSEDEIRTAEVRWSEWLAMEDWMVGARSPW